MFTLFLRSDVMEGGRVIFGNSSVSGSIGHLEITKDEMGKERTKERDDE